MQVSAIEKTQGNIPSCPFDGKISIKGKLWRSSFVDENALMRLVQKTNIPEMVARLMIGRGFDHLDMDEFFTPTLAKHFPDPKRLLNMEDAANVLAQAIQNKEKIGILADFDVDGATSCAVMRRFLAHVLDTSAEEIPFYIPDRLDEGYGPSIKAFDALKDQGCDWVVVVDSGITSHEPIAHAKGIGLKVVVVDHHEPEGELPQADYIVNPKLPEDTSDLDMLAAVGVTYLLCIAVNSVLRSAGYYQADITAPDMREFLDLVALGTVCDMVPLTGPNRLFVKQGFPMMHERRNVGLRALLTVSDIKSMPDPYHAGFMLGPRINAGSRVHQSDLGAQLLSTADEGEAMRLAWLLDECNEKRKAIQKDMAREAQEQAKRMSIENPGLSGFVLDGQGWHQGLSGLVAGAVKDKYEKPACVISYAVNSEGVREGRGSGRSVAGVNIAAIFQAARAKGLLVKGGGHAMAGGLTIEPDKIDAFRTFFDTQVRESLAHQGEDNKEHGDDIELLLSVEGLSIHLADMLNTSMGPFGMANPEPTTVLPFVTVTYADQVGVNHLRLTIQDMGGNRTMKAMAFRAFEGEMGKALRAAADSGRPVHLRGQVKVNEWQGRRSVEYHVDDAMMA